jgi:hypothetical protein
MNDTMKVIFSYLTDNVFKVKISIPPKVTIIDTVRISDDYYVDPISREALSHYTFWMQIKDIAGKNKPILSCTNQSFIEQLYNEYCKVVTCEPPENHWPFAGKPPFIE